MMRSTALCIGLLLLAYLLIWPKLPVAGILSAPVQDQFVLFGPDDADGAHPFPTYSENDLFCIHTNVFDSMSNQLGDLLLMCDQRTEREQFLEDQGLAIIGGATWRVGVFERAEIDGSTRVLTACDLGETVTETDGTGIIYDTIQTQHILYEVWKLSDVGGPPTLLERSMSTFNGLLIHAESPLVDPNLDYSSLPPESFDYQTPLMTDVLSAPVDPAAWDFEGELLPPDGTDDIGF